jgi:hypothetical protein
MQCSCTYGQSSAGAVLRRGGECGSVGVRCALSFCPPLQHQHFSATSSPPPQDPIIPSAPHRLRKAEDFACSVQIVSVAGAV